MSSKRSNNLKLLVFVGFLILLFSSAFIMYNLFIANQPTVDPQSVPHRTQQNPFLVDSLKKAGFYDSLGK